MLPTKLAFVDLETTGGRATFDRIIEIGILRVENNTVVDQFSSLINPLTHIPPSIEYLTGISADMVLSAPVFSDVQQKILELLDDCVFVAHNVRFDYGFLKNELRRSEKVFSAKQLCTVKLSRELFPHFPKHNLDSIIERFGFSCESRHRAFDDAELLWKFYQKLHELFDIAVLEQAYAKVTKKPTLPVHISQEMLDAVPERPGVYSFYGEDHVLLYVGKSTNLRDRVLSHFSSDYTSTKEMKISQQIRSLTVEETAGELGALLLESQKIKELFPLYNRQLRSIDKITCIVKDTTQPYTTLSLVQKDHIRPEEFSTLLGVFRSKKQAETYLLEKAKDYHLCHKLLKLEHTKSSCFQYRLDNCKGACVEKEKPLFYNLRFEEAFASTTVKQWPYPGAIALIEDNPDTHKRDIFVIDQWCLIDWITTSDDVDCLPLLEEVQTKEDLPFDLDTYKIIQKFLAKAHPGVHIVPLTKLGKRSRLSSNFFSDSLIY